MSVPYVKVFGERNTGTRALIQMLRKSGQVAMRTADAGAPVQQQRRAVMAARIEQHFSGPWRKLYLDALRDNERHRTVPLLTWKHAAPEWHDSFAEGPTHVIFMVRNPYSWVLSMARRPYHIAGRRTSDVEEFLTRPWLTQRRDNTEALLPDVLSLWQLKVLAYREFAKRAKEKGVPTYTIRFEPFVANPVSEAGSALRHFGISTEGLRACTRSTKSAGRSLSEIQKYYAQEEWRARLTRRTVALINARIDWGLAGKMGYCRLSPDCFPEHLSPEVTNQIAMEMVNRPRPPVLLDRETGAAATA